MYISRATLEFERHWPPLDLEAGSIVWCMKRFHNYLWGTQFRIYTDHKSLEHFAKVSDKNARVKRWLNTIKAPYFPVFGIALTSKALSLTFLVTLGPMTTLRWRKTGKPRVALSSQQGSSQSPDRGKHAVQARGVRDRSREDSGGRRILSTSARGVEERQGGPSPQSGKHPLRAGRVRLRRREGGRSSEFV